jgi:outer membrane protein OmpA-like peptidoglycan-associated protein
MSRPAAIGLFCMISICGQIGLAQDFNLDFPSSSEVMLSTSDTMALHSLAIGPFRDGRQDSQQIKAPLVQTAVRIAPNGRPNTLEVMGNLRDQVTQAGFEPVFECDTRLCGGFDFRYHLDLLPEPEMHVDLGDFRYFLAKRQGDFISLMVSKSTNYAFVQVTKLGDFAILPAKVGMASKSATLPPDPLMDPADPIARALTLGGAAVLDDILFASGDFRLGAGDYGSLQAVAKWLDANPDQGVLIRGYTDSSGDPNANLRLSTARAQTIGRYLIAEFGIKAGRIATDGMGMAMPRADNATAEGRMKNRRVEVTATPLN